MTAAAQRRAPLWVVIPALDEAIGIGATMRSLARQRDRDFSVLLVDNGSTDRTVETARAAATGLNPTVVNEPEKGTGAAADTGMRTAIDAGARLLARTDADCLAAPDWTWRMRAAFDDGLSLVAGRLRPRLDEGLGAGRRALLSGAVTVAGGFGILRPGNAGEDYLGRYLMTAGCNMGITAEMYQRAGGFPRSRIEDLHEDRALVNSVRRLSTRYASRPEVLVWASSRRVTAWGLVRTLGWYADHRYRPELVDIR